jgi:MFS family permease
MMACYAIMQFFFSPVLGGTSDRYGRRPVLLLSLLGLGIDYLFLAVANTLPLLFLGRIIAGVCGASFQTSFSGGGSSQNTTSGTTTGGITTLSAYYASKGKSLPSIIERGKIYESLGLGKITYYTGTAEQNTKLLNALLGQGINNGLALTPNGNNTNNQPTQVITGILSQGTLGNTVDFISRQDDLIENATELEHAMRNNLAPFLTTIPNRVSYEVRIVSSITTATGFQTRGTVQKVLTGYTTKGIPKYKNVYNKFAVLDLKIKTATGSLAKLATIVLGPVDAVKFQAQNIDLSGIAQTIQNNIIAPISSVEQQVFRLEEQYKRY